MPEVIFHSVSRAHLLHLKSEQKGFTAHGVAEVVQAKMARFENGIYKTSDEEEIGLIRNTPAYKNKRVFEVTRADEEALRKPVVESKVVRGAITSEGLKKEAGIESTTIAPGLKMESKKSGITKCDVSGCGKIFQDDFTGARLRMHKVSHRRKG